jgi:hypothetical protein
MGLRREPADATASLNRAIREQLENELSGNEPTEQVRSRVRSLVRQELDIYRRKPSIALSEAYLCLVSLIYSKHPIALLS